MPGHGRPSDGTKNPLACRCLAACWQPANPPNPSVRSKPVVKCLAQGCCRSDSSSTPSPRSPMPPLDPCNPWKLQPEARCLHVVPRPILLRAPWHATARVLCCHSPVPKPNTARRRDSLLSLCRCQLRNMRQTWGPARPTPPCLRCHHSPYSVRPSEDQGCVCSPLLPLSPVLPVAGHPLSTEP